MGFSARPANASIVAAVDMLGFDVTDLWTDYFAVGGHLGRASLAAYLDGTAPVSDHDHDMIALVLNEAFADRGHDPPLEYRCRTTAT
jgi:hypothetical protein